MAGLQDASLPRADKLLVPARVKGSLGIAAAARHMRRLFRPMGKTARQDVLAATAVDGVSSDGDFAGRAAYREAKKFWQTERARAGRRKGRMR